MKAYIGQTISWWLKKDEDRAYSYSSRKEFLKIFMFVGGIFFICAITIAIGYISKHELSFTDSMALLWQVSKWALIIATGLFFLPQHIRILFQKLWRHIKRFGDECLAEYRKQQNPDK